MQAATELELLSTHCAIALTESLYLTGMKFTCLWGTLQEKSKKEKSGLFQMYVGNKNTLMFFSNLGCSAEHKRFFLFSSFRKAFTQLNYFHFTRSH